MKKILPLLLLAAVASGILIYAQTTRRTAETATNTSAPRTVDVVIDTGDGQSNTYSVTNPSPATVFGATQAATAANNVIFTFDPPGQYGIFVRSIAGKVGDDQYFWNYKLNGVDGAVGADSQPIHDGDVITWTFTKIISQ